MPVGIDLRGSEAVLNSFDLHEQPFFAVSVGKEIKFTNVKEGEEGGRALLESWLNMLEENGGTSPLKITYYSQLDEQGELNKKYETGSNTFRLGEPYQPYNGQRANVGGYYPKGNSKLEEKIEELEARIAEMQEEKETEPEAVGGFNGVLQGLMNNPQIQEALIGRLITLVDTVLPPAKNSLPQMASVAGIEEDQDTKIQTALQILFNNGMNVSDMEKLAHMAVTNNGYFKTLLQMLRG